MKASKKNLKFIRRYATAEKRSLPDFFIAGTQKGGTTSLYTYLSQHPNIIAAFKKEVNFFKSPLMYRKGLRWYKSHFPTFAEKKSKNAITGEATPLMYSLHAPGLIRETVPDVKLIFLLRDPVRRAFSHYQHNLRRAGREELTFSEAIRSENSRITKNNRESVADSLYDDYSNRRYSYLYRRFYFEHLEQWRKFFPDNQVFIKESQYFYAHPQDCLKKVTNNRESVADSLYDDYFNRRYSYLYRGFYFEHLERWRKFFPDDQVFIEESEYFYAHPQDCLEKITDFLDLPRYAFNCKSSYNTGGYSESILQTDLQYLEEVYKSHNEKLFAALGRELWTVPLP